jgi:hypothetical protein
MSFFDPPRTSFRSSETARNCGSAATRVSQCVVHKMHVMLSQSAMTPIISLKTESYITTDGQSASLSWNKAPIWVIRPDFYYCKTVAGLMMFGVLSDEKTGLSFTNVTVSDRAGFPIRPT